MEEGRMFRGMTGEILRPAVCTLIGKLSLSKLPFHGDAIIGKFHSKGLSPKFSPRMLCVIYDRGGGQFTVHLISP